MPGLFTILREAYPHAVDPSTAASLSVVTRVVVSVSNILMNRTRTRILRVLFIKGPATCTELSSELRLSLSAIRRHLNLLTAVGLVERIPAGRFRACPEKVRGEAEAVSATYLSGVMPPGTPPIKD